MSNKLKITVEGIPCSGKSTVMTIIADALSKEGLPCRLTFLDGYDSNWHLSRKLDSLKEKETIIEIVEASSLKNEH